MVKDKKNSDSKQAELSKLQVLTDYEKQRFMTIEKNALKFKELGLDKLAMQLLEKNKSCNSKRKEKLKVVIENDDDYVPDLDQDEDSEEDLFENFEDMEEASVLVRSTIESAPKKVLNVMSASFFLHILNDFSTFILLLIR